MDDIVEKFWDGVKGSFYDLFWGFLILVKW